MMAARLVERKLDMNSRKRNGGFTLIEVMLVLMILAGLAALAVFAMGGRAESAKIDMTKIRVQRIMGFLGEYHVKFSHYPSEEEGGLQALVTKPGSLDDESGGKNWYKFAEASQLKDDWGSDLKYELVDDESSKQAPRVSSSGPDKEHGTDDDIKSWSEEEGS